MSIVILGGNDCMVRKYKEICKDYNCSAKVFTHMKADLKKQIGSPDLLVMFTGTMSHKMARCVNGLSVKTVRVHSGSASALKNVLISIHTPTHDGRDMGN